MTHQDDWVDMATWLSSHPPAFFAADKSSFQGINAFPPPRAVADRLSEDSTEVIDWTGCAIRQEFGEERDDGLLTVHEFMRRRLQGEPNVIALIYDHRSGEAADFISINRLADGRIRVSLYHCKKAGGEPSGGRVDDVYEVTCQILKSVAYCETDILARHIEHRINPGRNRNPSTFIVGNLEETNTLLLTTPVDQIEFAVFGVQPGISRAAINEHLTDLMAFSLDYVLRGGAATAAWQISA